MVVFNFLALLFLIFFASTAKGVTPTSNNYPFYIGVTGGYGSTTWGQLVPQKANEIGAMNTSTPVSVNEGGAIWGLEFGYEFIPLFALEGDYMHYPTAHIHFDPSSIFTFDHHGLTKFDSYTDSLNLIGKFMLFIPHTEMRVFSSVGGAFVYRHDVINDIFRLCPVFGVGINYNVTPRVMLELGLDYTAGYGESELDPAEDFVPFLYTAFLRVAYRFGS